MFAVGDKVVYPMHGAGVVKTIEKRERDGQSVDYLILKVMVPVDSVERVGLRHVIENDDIDAVEKVLEERPDNYNKAITWNRRFNMYLEKMKSGNVFEVADVIRTLQVQENEKKLSTGERRLLGTARQILISEVMLVKNAEQQDIENWLNKFF
jgi:CarD family transcriptional regulator